MTQDPHTDWGDVDPARIAALLNPLKEWDAMTPEERAEAAGPHRRDVLGSFEETTELNRSERGNADPLFLWIGSLLVGFGLLMTVWHWLAWFVIGGALLLTFAAVVCVAGAGGRR